MTKVPRGNANISIHFHDFCWTQMLAGSREGNREPRFRASLCIWSTWAMAIDYVGILLWFCGCCFILLDLMLMCKSAWRSWFHYRKYFRILRTLFNMYIYICVCVSFCSPKMISWTRSSMRTPIFWAMQRTFLVWMYESMVFQCSLNPLHTRSKVQKNLCRHNLDAGTTLISNTFWYTISIYQYNMNIISFWCAC